MSTTKAQASANAELEKAEQAVKAAADTETTQPEQKETQAPSVELGQAVKELMEKKGFKDPEDIARAYQSLESRFTRTEQAKRELENRNTELQQNREVKQLSDQEQQALQLLESTIDKVISKKLRPIQDTLGVQKVDRMISDMAAVHPDFKGAIVDQVMDYMMERPSLSMEEAYRLITYDQRRGEIQSQVSKEKRTQETSRAFVESAGHSKTGTDIDYSKLSAQELEDILPAVNDYVDLKGTLRRG
jgi:hypothetical protein